LSSRLSVQQSLFLFPDVVDKTFMENLAEMGSFKRGIVKMTLPMSERGRALEQLRKMNITRTSLFPGLDGFAQSFRTLLVRDDIFNAWDRAKNSRLLLVLARHAEMPRRTRKPK
jgi:hypothetical protein